MHMFPPAESPPITIYKTPVSLAFRAWRPPFIHRMGGSPLEGRASSSPLFACTVLGTSSPLLTLEYVSIRDLQQFVDLTVFKESNDSFLTLGL